MNDRNYCGNETALIATLYDECEPAEREAIEAHIARCASCADEFASLRLTRTRLAAWTPPDAALGFRITRDDAVASAPAPVLTSPRWSSRPLPAWLQAAAAVAIFAGGLAAGSLPQRDANAVSHADIEALRGEIARLQAVTTAPAASVDEDVVVARVAEVVDQRVGASETRLRAEFARETAQLARAFDVARAGDLVEIQGWLAGFRRTDELIAGRQQVAGSELQLQRQAIGRIYGGSGQIVPVSLAR